MPFVTIITSCRLNAEQKHQLMRRICDIAINTLSGTSSSVRIFLHELPTGHYYCAGEFDAPAMLFSVDLIEGRTEQAKAQAIESLSRAAHEITGVSEESIRVRLCDFPKENMGLANGITAKQAGR